LWIVYANKETKALGNLIQVKFFELPGIINKSINLFGTAGNIKRRWFPGDFRNSL
jgi:hypothetical protein